MGNIGTSKAITFLDVETICIDPIDGVDTLLSIAFITDWDDGTQSTDSFKIKMTKEKMDHADEEALKVNNYSEEGWKNAKSLDQIAPIIANQIAWGPLVAHNAQFDISHITSSLNSIGWRRTAYRERWSVENCIYQVGYPVIDTCALAYLFLPTERQNLDVLREAFDINKDGAHEALKDTEDCRTIFYKMITSIDLNL